MSGMGGFGGLWHLVMLPVTWLAGTVFLLPVVRTTLRHTATVSAVAIALFAPVGVVAFVLLRYLAH